MGCSVIWSYWDQFGGSRLARIVLVDQPVTLVADPTWPEGQARTVGAIFTPERVYRDAARIAAGTLAEAGTDTMSQSDRAFFARCDALLPPEHRATLLIDHAFQDWRDVLPRITLPTLVVGGVMFPQGMNYLAAQIPQARLEVFTADELGTHFMFWENPDKFNRVLAEFLGDVGPCHPSARDRRRVPAS
jgi:pimeloyl-ACP methyl ester carboxylesterase